MLRDTLMILTLTNIAFLVFALFKLMHEGIHIGREIEEIYVMYKEAPLNTFMMFFLIGILFTAYNVICAVIACLLIKHTVFRIAALLLVLWSFGSILNMIRYRIGGKSYFSTSTKIFLLYFAAIINFAYLFYVLSYVLNLYKQ
ncbi:MAG: hypothetical protein ACM3KR_04605 [Deltaproteobacteria bacterium]